MCIRDSTSADVKAESDICCTSSNAVAIVEHITSEWGVNKVIMLPDEFLAKNVAKQTDIDVIAWHGRCEVHARFSAQDVRDMREANPGVVVLAHPECPPEVVAESDFTGSTKAMSDYVSDNNPKNVILLTECSMSDNVAMANPKTDFVRPCNLCPHMKRITLENIYECLRDETNEVLVDERRIGGPFEFRNEIADLVIKVICCRFHLIIILKTASGRRRDRANPVLNFKGLTNPTAIFPIDEFLTHMRNPPELIWFYIGRAGPKCHLIFSNYSTGQNAQGRALQPPLREGGQS